MVEIDIIWPSTVVIIPAHNEEKSIPKVLREIPNWVEEIIVVNNGSTDQTALVSENEGATVVEEPRLGYGYACLRAMDYLAKKSKPPKIIVFLDGDYSDYPEEMVQLLQPIISENTDFVLGARVAELRHPHSMTPQQLVGNWLATTLMRWIYGGRYTDLGPFRAIKYDRLLSLNMQDKTYGWTVEMQLKALRKELSYKEVPVHYRKRIGVSKVSGTIKGTIFAGAKILGWIFKYSIR